jgi:hypothetical protein
LVAETPLEGNSYLPPVDHVRPRRPFRPGKVADAGAATVAIRATTRTHVASHAFPPLP